MALTNLDSFEYFESRNVSAQQTAESGTTKKLIREILLGFMQGRGTAIDNYSATTGRAPRHCYWSHLAADVQREATEEFQAKLVETIHKITGSCPVVRTQGGQLLILSEPS